MGQAATLLVVARTRVSYAEAVRLLTGKTDAVTVLGRLAGGALLIAAPFAPGVLALFDAKGEANALLRDLVGAAPARIRASRGKRHYELLEAAHAVLIVSSFFDALAETHGEHYARLQLTDEEKQRIGAKGLHPLRDKLARPSAPTPGALRSFTENLPAVEDALRLIAGACSEFVGGLAAGRSVPQVGPAVVADALARYTERYVRLSADVPEFSIWSQLSEHAATRAEVRRQTDTLTRLTELLAGTVTVGTPAVEAEERLARHATAVLHRPLWRAENTEGLSFPTVEQGFISPRFRMTVVDKDSPLANEAWWERKPTHGDLARFLAEYFADPACTQQPLVILGHPGAGKSLLTEVIAARLPAGAFTTVRVPLRAVNPDAQIHQQVEATVERLVKERLSWGELCRASDTTKVVLLDGFDELVQATGVAQSHYISLAAGFQQEEWINERPVAVVITSRTLVMDRTVVPEGTIVVKLEPFDEDQVGRWIGAWNAANTNQPGVRPLAPAELWHHRDLASQPLLLLMLAIYAAQGGAVSLGTEDLSTEDLYRRLLDEFIRRQVRDKARTDLGPAAFTKLEAEGRRDLAAVAFAMFNRGHQYVSEDDLDRDLEALHPGSAPAEATPGEPLTRARRTIAGFFFVHVAQTDDARAPGRRTYEFLHATFAEYLVAEQTTELLGNLADDWRRSRRRSYGASLDERVLRALLSHQPLSNGDQILPFLTTLIQGLSAEVRGDLREALLELFRGARCRVPDDPYRPSPFDVVGRVAAYTANLALLATLCDPAGLPVAALCDAPDAPSIESTVRLWRSALDPEAQLSFFLRLRRSAERFVIETDPPALEGLPVAEARLIRDRYAEAVYLAGRHSLPEQEGITAFQRDFHLQVMRIVGSRWPGSPTGRMMPYDETIYLGLARLAEGSSEAPLSDSLSLLVRHLIDDDRQLSGDLVDRILTKMIMPHTRYLHPRLSVLALRRPELLTRHPWLRQALPDRFSAAFVHEVALAMRDEDPAAVDPIITELRAMLSASDVGGLSSQSVTPSMVSNLTFAPDLLPSVIASLDPFGELAWSQVPPRDMLTALDAMGDRIGQVKKPLANYVASRVEDNLDEEDRAALAQIHARLGPG